MNRILNALVFMLVVNTYGITLKGVLNQDNYQTLKMGYAAQVDSIETLNIHMSFISEDYGFKSFNDVPELVLIQEAWATANKEQQTYFDFKQSEMSYNVELSDYGINDVFIGFWEFNGNIILTGVSGGSTPFLVFSEGLEKSNLLSPREYEKMFNVFQYEFFIDQNVPYDDLNFETMEGMIEYKKRYAKATYKNFCLKTRDKKLEIPSKYESKNLSKYLTNDWSYSNYRYVSEEEFKKRTTKPSDSYRLEVVEIVEEQINQTMVSLTFINNENEEVLYRDVVVGVEQKGKLQFNLVLAQVKTAFDQSGGVGSLEFDKKNYDYNYLPKDLDKEAIGFVRLGKGETPDYKWINTSFDKKMKKYPYKILSTEVGNSSELKKCKYAMKLSVSIVYVEKKYYDEIGVLKRTKVVPQYRFVLYIEDKKTGKTFCTNQEPDRYWSVFKSFVNNYK